MLGYMNQTAFLIGLCCCFRNRRKHKREAQGIRDHNDGFSTDDEFSISEITKFKAEHGAVTFCPMSCTSDFWTLF